MFFPQDIEEAGGWQWLLDEYSNTVGLLVDVSVLFEI